MAYFPKASRILSIGLLLFGLKIEFVGGFFYRAGLRRDSVYRERIPPQAKNGIQFEKCQIQVDLGGFGGFSGPTNYRILRTIPDYEEIPREPWAFGLVR